MSFCITLKMLSSLLNTSGNMAAFLQVYERFFGLKPSIDHRNYSDVVALAEYIRDALAPEKAPEVGIVCGSGLMELADGITEKRTLSFAHIPGFPQPSVPGHAGNIIVGYFGGKYVFCMQGRFHPYEHDMDLALCAMPIRLMHRLGVKTVLLTTAVGGINEKFRRGDFMMIKDHICMPAITGHSPLLNLNGPDWGPRFISQHNIYDIGLRALALDVAKKQNITVHEGVYLMCGGPQYESGAEINFFKAIGADAIGMSTCHEAIVARQCGMKVLGLAVITNLSSDNANPSHLEVLETMAAVAYRATKFLDEITQKLRC